jgi:hypothetical protein
VINNIERLKYLNLRIWIQFPKATTVQDEEFERELNKFVHEGMEAQRKMKTQRALELKLPMSLLRYK